MACKEAEENEEHEATMSTSESAPIDLSSPALAVVGYVIDSKNPELRTLELAQRYFERRVGQRGATEDDVCQTLVWLAAVRVQLLNSKGAMHTLAHLRARARGRVKDIESWASILEILLHTEMREWRQANSRLEMLRVESSDPRTLARLTSMRHQLKGRILSAQGQIKPACAEFEQALAALRVGAAQIEDLAITAELYNDQGQALHREGQLEEAIKAYANAETVANHINFPLALARSLRGRGQIELGRKAFTESIPLLKHALDICQRHDTPYGTLRCSISLGRAHYGLTDLREALFYFEEARLQCGKGRYPVEEAEVSARIGDVMLSEGQYQKAAECYESDLQLTSVGGDERSRAHALRNVGRIQRLLGNFGRSETCLQESASLFYKLGDRLGLGQTLQQMVQCSLEQGKTLEARDYFTRLRQCVDATKSPHEIGVARMLEGIVLRHEGKSQEALMALEHSMGVLAKEPGFFMVLCQLEIAQAHKDLQDNDLAVHHLKAAIQSARRLKHHDIEKRALDFLAKIDRSAWARIANSAASVSTSVSRVERQVLSILALQLCNSRWLWEQQPERVVALLDGFYAVSDQVAQRHRGLISRVLGHRVLIVFGLDGDSEPSNVLRCAENSLLAFHRLQSENSHYANLGVTASIATGHAVHAVVGPPDRKEFSLLGEPVELIERLLEQANSNEVCVCSDTYRSLPSDDSKAANQREISARGDQEKFFSYVYTHARQPVVAPARSPGAGGSGKISIPRPTKP